MNQTFFMAVSLLIGLALIISSFYLTPLVENSTDRAKQSVIGVQILGVAILSILGTKLTCQGNPRDFDILLGIMFVFVGVSTGLFWVIYTDCVESREFTIYALNISIGIVCTIIGLSIYLFFHKRKKTEPEFDFIKAYEENFDKSGSESRESNKDLKDLQDLEDEEELQALLYQDDLLERKKIASEIKKIKEERKKIDYDEYNKSLKDFKKMQGELSKTTSDKNSAKIRQSLSKTFADSERLANRLNSDT